MRTSRHWEGPLRLSSKTMCVMLTLLALVLMINSVVVASSNFHFTHSVYNATIKENAPPRTNVTSEQKMGIYVSDTSLRVEYSITDGDEIFSVHSHQVGDFAFLRVRVKPCQSSDRRCRKLNRESKARYTVAVSAEGIQGEVVVARALAVVTVFVLDINDALPVFHSLRHQVTIPEDLPVGSSIAHIQAVDADVGSNGEIYYSLKRDTNDFAIHPSSGEVTLTRPLTEIEQATFTLEVVAKDRGQMVYGDSPISESPTASLRITVTTVNKYEPKIVVTKLPKLTRKDKVFAEVSVTDADEGQNGEIQSLELEEDDFSSFFQVQSLNSEGRYQVMVLQNSPLLPTMFNLTLIARDNGSPMKMSYHVLTTNLDKTMSYSSLFVSSSVNVSISELTPINTPIINIAPHDAPTDALEYSVMEADVPFAVVDGVLIVADDLDRGLKQSYNISVKSFDQLDTYLGMCHVSIFLIDENNHSPVFDQESYEVDFDENQDAGTVVTVVMASDEDEGENGYVFYSIANLNQVPFKIDYMTGVITSTELLDFETMRSRYTLLVRASDWGAPYQRESQVTVSINLAPVNDNPPQFEKVNCTGTISKSHPAGLSIALLPAVDFDSSTREILFSEGNVNDLFYVDPSTGNLTLKRRIADDDPRFYQLKIMVTDGPGSFNFMTTNITIVGNRRNPSNGDIVCGSTYAVQQFAAMAVQREKSDTMEDQFPGDYQNIFNSNPNAPQFHVDFPESITIPENSPVGSSVFTILARDPDQGYNGMVLFSILDGNVGYPFKLMPESGDVVILRPLDREHLDRYTLTIALSDLGEERKSTRARLTVIVEDSNDNPPIFENERYDVEIAENIETGMTFLHVSATDDDIGENGEVQYYLEGNPEAFQVGISSGDVRVAANLDREANEIIELTLVAQDMSAEEPLSTKTSLTIHLMDVNDNAPSCILPLQKFKVREDLPLRASLFQVKAVDPDAGRNSSIHYSFTSGDEGKFEIDPDYGIVRLVAALDFEDTPVYNMTVELQDGGVPHLSSTCDLVVEVIDVNENLHPPVFPDFVITASVEENAEVGREVIAVTATDMDEGRDGEVSYFIRGGSGLGMFMVDKFGIIRTKAVLDRESQSHYWLTVYAQDNAAVPLHSIVEVYIQVSDVNDNAPFPTLPVFRGYIPENSGAGTDIIRVEVEDLDETESQNITFEIPSKKIRRMFQIDRTTGMISTANSRLDREDKSSYLFDVDVSDNGDPAHTSTANVIIEILDVNDNAPVFHQMNYGKVPVRPVELVEDEQHTILRVFAYDDDQGENATVSYVIPTGQERQTRFGVDAQTGEVKCSKSLVEGESFTLMIDAFDNGPIQEKSRLTLLLTVIDPIQPSSLAPVFDEFFSDPLYENVAPGTFVTTVFAFDSDSNPNDVIYTITGGNHDAAFTNQQSAIFVAKPLDAETRTSYDLEITASDGFNTASSILHLDVLDANEFAPVFGHDQYEVSVPENIGSGKRIIQLDVSDRDVTSRLFYSISSTAHPDSKSRFKINSDTGEIYVRNPLDHEGIRQHILTVKVRDVGHISFHSFTTVVVTVLDFNDHMPYFGADHYEGQVFETAETGTVVVHVQGYDNDKDVNAELEYSILSGNKEDAFHMDPVLGNIMTTRELNIEDQAKYSLRVQVMDHGTPSLSNTATVNITVVLSNSAPPRFVQDEFITELEENLSPGQFVLHPDVISKSSVFFDIAGGNERDHFEIDSSSGVVLSKLPLDFEMVEVYNLTIQAVNMVGGSALAHLIIHVLDVNDNAPLFIQEVYVGTITESSPMNTVVSDEDNHHLVVGAIDLDFDQNARLVYSIVEEDAAQYFVIDENTGAIRSLMSLDHETHPTFEFHVTVHDSGSQILSARNPALVKVTVQDINDSPPVFVEEDYEASLLLPTFEDVLVSQVVVTDPDSVSLSNLYYSIRAGNAGSHFKIKPTTGEILVAEPQRIEGRYHLQVEVSDGLHTSQTQVRIITKQTASSDLQFRSNQTDATVVENSTGITYIAQVAVVGTGLNEPVAYTILNPTDCFSINARSGSLRTTGIPLDRETKDRYMLVVEARDDRRPPRIARTVVFVEVADVNDNSPVFVHHEYNAIVQVDARVGEIVRTVLALDADDGSNGEVEYTLMGGAEGYFDIDPVSGDIRVQNVMGLDVENRNFTLLVQASDKGKERRSSIVEVPIIVRNKAMPVFREQYYSASIAEDIQLFSSVVQIEAISPSGRKLIYSVSNGNPYKHFDITPLTGVITVTGSLDYETQNRYTLTVQASDTLTGVSSSVMVDIAVEDVNDMAPRFPMQVYHKVLSEGFPVSSTVLQLSASDQDSDAFNKIRYSLETDSDEVSSLFRVDASSGILFTLKQLDHETADSFNFTVVASDNGVPPLKGVTLVSLRVTDMNDNPPSFLPRVYQCTVSEGARRGSFVGKVSAVDPDKVDEGILVYSIVSGNDDMAFSINSGSGVISLSSTREPELSSFYDLTVAATDQVFTSSTMVTVRVTPINKHAPSFMFPNYNIFFAENETNGSSVYQVEAVDEDEGIFGEIVYSILSDLARSLFEIDRDTGEIKSRLVIDQDVLRSRVFQIPILATDGGGRTGYTNVNLNLKDRNSYAPQFELSKYQGFIQTGALAGTTILTVHAIDKDYGSNALVSYTFSEGTSLEIKELFDINRQTGEVFTKRDLTEQAFFGQFFLQATDHGSPEMTGFVPVEVTILHSQQTVPSFDSTTNLQSLTISEDTEVGTVLTRFHIDGNATSFLYTLVPGNTAHTNSPVKFSISREGELSLTSSLDHEITSWLSLTVKAVPMWDDPPVVSFHQVAVTISDVNDNPPVFKEQHYRVKIEENCMIGSQVIQVQASDADTDETIMYEIVDDDGGHVTEAFQIHPNTGAITTVGQLDRETIVSYTIRVQATDGAVGDDIRHTTVTHVEVGIVDINDSPPHFMRAVYNAAVREDAETGTVVTTVEAHDGDVDHNADLTYYIISGDPCGHFLMDSLTGDIAVTKFLDRESRDRFVLNVTASDGVFTHNTKVIIEVEDVNTHAPSFLQVSYKNEVMENQEEGLDILQVEATDIDVGENGLITYSLQGDGSEMFRIDPQSGMLQTSVPLDYELQRFYHFEVLASDGGGLRDAALLSISVMDQNDNPPMFTQSTYNVSVSENTTTGSLLTRLQAVDRDSGAYRQFAFSFVDSEEDIFLIDRQSGIVTLNGILDREVRSEYNLTVKVSDVSQTGGHFTLGNLIIDVLDENDNEPMFEHDLYNATIAENVEVETVILTVRALSADEGLNALVTYAIDSGNEHGKFEIDGTTGGIRVRDALDFEKEHAYYLTVKASDAGVRPLSDTTMVNIQVTDVNDNSPVFSQDIYNSEVIEAARVGDSVVQVMASDIDSGPLGDVSYTIDRGDLFNLFTIGSKNGLISLAAELDREQSSSYSLVVRASDSGEVARSQEVTVKISVVDINDNAPRFSSHNYTIIRKEDTPLHTLLIQFNVTDADSPGNGPPFTFSMVSGDRSGFHITYDGALTNTIAFNRKVKETYSLTVMATDSGKPALSSEVSVTIIVVETKNAPVVSSPLVVNIVSYQNAFPGGFIARVTASDSDPYDVLEYSVVTDTSQAFQIERESGKIIADPDLDIGSYPLNVSVSDGEFTSYARVDVEVQEVTLDMLENSAVIRFTELASERFIAFAEIFKHTVANIVREPESENVHIISIQRSEVNPADTDVLFAVQSDRNHSYLKSKTLVKRINGSTSSLEERMLVAVKSVFGEPCLTDACQAGFRCEGSFVLDYSEVVTIATEAVSFVSARHRGQHECICSDDATCGIIHTTTSATPLNPCDSSPCKNNELCVPTAKGGYTCTCLEENDPLCEGASYTPLFFTGESYVAIKDPVLSTTSTQLSAAIHTTASNGVIMYGDGEFDFSILEIEEGYVYFHFECGSGEAHIRLTQQKVDDGDWHQVAIKRHGNSATITLDGQYSSSGTAPGFNRELNLNTLVFGGNVPAGGQRKRRAPTVVDGFSGCMGDVNLNGKPLNLKGDGTDGPELMECPSVFRQACQDNPCQNGGSCLDHGYRYQCVCPPGFTGHHCEHHLGHCTSKPCANGGTCHTFENEFWCSCPTPFFGKLCLAESCADRPCQNKGDCIDSSVDGLSCNCSGTGFEGIYCQQPATSCAANPCPSDEEHCRMDAKGSFVCCGPDATDRTCNTVGSSDPNMSGSATGITFMEIGIIGGIFVVVLIVVLILLLAIRRRRKRRQRALETRRRDGDRYQSVYANDPDGYQPSNKLEFPIHVAPFPRAAPEIPEYPTGYTRSTNTSMNDLGSDISDQYRGQQISHAPSLPPLPSHSASDNESITKPAWDFDTTSNQGSYIEVRGSNKNLPIAPTKLQHSQPSILTMGHHQHNIPKDDPPAYTAPRHRPAGADTISMSSINTANTENDTDTLRANTNNSMSDGGIPSDSLTLTNKGSSKSKSQDELISSSESVSKALENISDTEVSDDENVSVVDEKAELRVELGQEKEEEKEPLAEDADDVNEKLAEKEPLVDKVVTPGTPKSVRFNMIPEVNQFQTDAESQELESNQSEVDEDDQVQESSFQTVGALLEKRESGDGLESEMSDISLTEDEDLIGDGDISEFTSGDDDKDDGEEECRKPFLSKPEGEGCPSPLKQSLPEEEAPLSMYVPPSYPTDSRSDPMDASARNHKDPRKKGMQWDYSDCTPKPESVYNLNIPQVGSSSPTSTHYTQGEYDVEEDDEYVGEETDYQYDEEDDPEDFSIARATEEFQAMLRQNYSPEPISSARDDSEESPIPRKDYQQHPNKYMPAHKISQNSVVPPGYDDGAAAATPGPNPIQRSRQPRRRSYDRTTSAEFGDYPDRTSTNLDNLSMSAYTDTNASCSDVSGMCDQESDEGLNGYESMDDQIKDLSHHTDL